MYRAIFILNPEHFERIYPAHLRAQIRQFAQFEERGYSAQEIQANPELLHDVEVILSAWGMVPLTEELLAHAPKLQVVFYGAGSIRYFTSEAFWRRGIRVTSAYTVNGEFVANFTMAQILLSCKRFWHYTRQYHEIKKLWKRDDTPGMYRSRVGIISLGAIGRQVVELLKSFDLDLYAYDPFWTQERADALGITLLPLDDIFTQCDIVSLHTPWLPETVGMITGDHIASMKTGSTFINTARGAVVREAEMIAALQARPDITALLDVTYPEPPVPDSLLFSLPNVVLSPHIAGAISREVEKMGALMAAEFARWVRGEAMQNEIDEARAKILA